MEKLVYLIFHEAEFDGAELRAALLDKALPALREAGALLVDAALKRADGNQTIAANLLGITQPSLSKRLKLRRAIKHKKHNSG